MRVLLVGKDLSGLKVLEPAMWAAGFSEVSYISRGSDAFKLEAERKFEIILVMYELDDMSGVDLLQKIRLARSQTPMMFVSAGFDAGERARALGFGADDYVVLPIENPEDFVSRIITIASRGPAFYPSSIF